MAAIRWEGQPWAAVPVTVLRNPELSAGEVRLFALLISYAWQDESCYPGQTQLAADMGVTDRQVRTTLQKMADHGLIRTEQAGNGRNGTITLIASPEENFHPAARKKTSAPARKKTSGPLIDKVDTGTKKQGPDGPGSSGTDPETLAAARRLFDLWHGLMEKDGKTRYTDERRKKLVTRLKRYSEDDIATAIRRVAGSKWHRDNGHTELVMIVGSDERLEKYRDMPERPGDQRQFVDERRTKPEDAPW